ncbi:MAG: hypothetical protein WBA93_18170 [Microcoleaceae cyanobacterium]
MMNRFIYENSVSYQGYLMIPYLLAIANDNPIYSYQLLSELGHEGNFHRAENLTGLYSNSIEKIIKVAKSHLYENSDVVSHNDYFKLRYVYSDDLIILHQEADKFFYDHYKPRNLTNVAAPKIFQSDYECINWVKAGLDRTKMSG